MTARIIGLTAALIAAALIALFVVGEGSKAAPTIDSERTPNEETRCRKVCGSVRDEGMRPIADCTVQLIHDGADRQTHVATGTADQQGFFTLTLLAPVPTGTACVVKVANTDGAIIMSGPVIVGPDIIIACHRTTVLHGLVADEEGAPIAGAMIRISTELPNVDQSDIPFDGTTDGAGNFAVFTRLPVHELPPNWSLSCATANGRWWRRVSLDSLVSASGSKICLSRRPIGVSVHNQAGEPVPDASLAIIAADASNGFIYRNRADSEGRHTFVGDPLPLEIFAWRSDHQVGSARHTPGAGRTEIVVVAPAEPTRTITLRAVGAEGEPLVGAKVLTSPHRPGYDLAFVGTGSRVTDERGLVEFPLVSDVFPYQAQMTHPIQGRSPIAIVGPTAESFTIQPQSGYGAVDLKLVGEQAGFPFYWGSTQVWIRDCQSGAVSGKALWNYPYELRLIKAGRYELVACLPGRNLVGSAFVDVAPNKRSRVTVPIGVTLAVTGVVRDQDGLPVAGCHVYATRGRDGQVAPSWCWSVSDDHGRFDVRGIPATEREVFVRAKTPGLNTISPEVRWSGEQELTIVIPRS